MGRLNPVPNVLSCFSLVKFTEIPHNQESTKNAGSAVDDLVRLTALLHALDSCVRYGKATELGVVVFGH